MSTFEGKTAIITGGASGIGRAIGEAMARSGSTVVLADLQAELAAEVADGIEKAGGRARGVALDVTDREAVDELVRSTASDHGRLDYLFNNAGIGVIGEMRDYAFEDWTRVLDVCLRGVVHGVHAAYPRMVEQGSGHIVNTASMAGITPSPGLGSYTTAKHAVVGLSTALRVEGADLGVKVSVVCPGVIATPLVDSIKILEEETFKVDRHELLKLIPGGTYTPKQCAEVVLEGVKRNRAIITVTPFAAAMWRLYRSSPDAYLALSSLVGKRLRKRFGR